MIFAWEESPWLGSIWQLERVDLPSSKNSKRREILRKFKKKKKLPEYDLFKRLPLCFERFKVSSWWDPGCFINEFDLLKLNLRRALSSSSIWPFLLPLVTLCSSGVIVSSKIRFESFFLALSGFVTYIKDKIIKKRWKNTKN